MFRCALFVLAVVTASLDSVFAQEDAARKLADEAVVAAGGAEALPKWIRWSERWRLGDSETANPRDATIGPPKTWIQNGKDIAEGNADRTEKTYLVWAWTLAPLKEADSRFTALGERKIRDVVCDGLALERDDGPKIELWFARDGRRLTMLAWRAYEIDFDDWRETGGYRYPGKAYVRRKDGSLHLWTEFVKFETFAERPE